MNGCGKSCNSTSRRFLNAGFRPCKAEIFKVGETKGKVFKLPPPKMKEQDYFRVHNKAVTLLKTILKEKFCEQVYNFKLKN